MIVQSDNPKHERQHETRPQLWQLLAVAIGVVILTACRGPARTTDTASLPCPAPSDIVANSPALPCPERTCPPQSSAAGMLTAPLPAVSIPHDGAAVNGMPLGCNPCTGNCRAWADDEFLADGGDMHPAVRVRPDWEVLNLSPEETVAHFDTLDGQTIVEPSNRVCIYAPRFCAVRKVEGLVQNAQSDRLGDINKPVSLVRCEEVQEPTSNKQQIEPVLGAAARPPLAFISEQGDGAVSEAVGPEAYQDALQPYESLELIRSGTIDADENARLTEGIEAAVAWSDTQAVVVILDHVTAQTDVGVKKTQTTYTVDQPPANPKLRLVKIASRKTAKPGEFVAFTLRFDNVGNQPIGNVTVIDNLTTRLEFVPDTDNCSLPADFIVEKNSVGSDILRWELKEPLAESAGGVIRFKCRVR